MTFIVTAYCACHLCCGPHSTGFTASGSVPTQGITAAGPRRLPFGTRIYIATIGERTIEDRLAHRYNNRIDIYMARHADAKAFGKRKLAVTIFKPLKK
jgi:3D (Asp-Asp-Asp) domain-containing protein